MLRHLLPSAGSRGASSPASAVLRGAPTPERPSRRASLPSLGGTSRAPLLRSRRRATRSPASLGFGLRSPDRLSREETLRSPRFLGEPPCVHALLFDPGGISAPGHPAPRCSLPHGQRRRLPQRSNSRGSIPRPARSLCTLRSEDRSSTTQHSVPAGGPPLPGGVGYPLGSPRRVSAVIHPA